VNPVGYMVVKAFALYGGPAVLAGLVASIGVAWKRGDHGYEQASQETRTLVDELQRARRLRARDFELPTVTRP
jgi:hypothetical protein